MSNSHTAFFYGTLMAAPVLHRVCHGPADPSNTIRNNSPLSIRPALLPGFRRHRVKRADYPAIVPNAASSVRGTLVSGLTDADIWRLDIFEGSEYARVPARARPIADPAAQKHHDREPREDQLGPEVEVETYVWIGDRKELAQEEWDFEEFVREKMWRWAGSGAEEEGKYDEFDEAVLGVENGNGEDPTGGRSVNGAISKAMEENREKEKALLGSAV